MAQALGRKKRDKMKVEKVRVMRQNLDQVEGDALLGYTVNQVSPRYASALGAPSNLWRRH